MTLAGSRCIPIVAGAMAPKDRTQKPRLRPEDKPGIADPVLRAKALEHLADWSTRPNPINDPHRERRALKDFDVRRDIDGTPDEVQEGRERL